MGNSIPAQHPAVVLRSRYRQLRALLAVMVVAVVGLSTTVVVLSLDDETTTTATTTHVASGKPDESAVAAAISQSGGRSYPTLADPFRSQVEQPRPLGGPDESTVASSISPQTGTVSAPDEARIASSLAEHSDVGPQARARAWQEKLDSMSPRQKDEAFVKGH